MKLTTIAQTLDFLQDEYKRFNGLSDTECERQKAHAKSLWSREKSTTIPVPLRTLYIDLAMHDELVRHSQESKQNNTSHITMLLKNKIAIQKMIRQREKSQEWIIPDEKVHQLILDYQDDTDQIPEQLSRWMPESKRNDFMVFMQPLWTTHRNSTEGLGQIMQGITRQYISWGMKSVSDFRLLVSMLETLLQYEQLTRRLQES